jgi:hypothetical protein
MSRKQENPRANAPDIRQLSQHEHALLLKRVEAARHRKAWNEVCDPNTASGDAMVDVAAREYSAAVESKNSMRRAGYGRLPPDSQTLAAVVAKHFPGLDAAAATRVEESVRQAAEKFREP